MANELVHGSQGTVLTQAEFEAVGLHVCNSQATGDLIYASSATQLSRLGIGATNTVLTVIGGVPAWVAPIKFTELANAGDKQAAGAGAWEDWDISAIVPAGSLSALIDIRNASGTSQLVGIRKNGSALVRALSLYNATSRTWLTEVDANRVVEIYVATSAAGVYYNVLGYWS